MEPLLPTRQAADVLCVSPRTLEAWRRNGGGPKFVRISANRCAYEPASLREWADARRRVSNTEGQVA